MITISDFPNSAVHDEQAPFQTLPLFSTLNTGNGINGTVAVKNPVVHQRNLFSGRFSIKGGFCGSGAQRRMIIVGKIGKF